MVRFSAVVDRRQSIGRPWQKAIPAPSLFRLCLGCPTRAPSQKTPCCSYKTSIFVWPVQNSRAGNSLIRSSLIRSSLIRSFRSNQMSDCERFAQIAQDKWATVSESLRSLRGNERPWANRSGRSRQMSDHEQVAQVAQRKWANEWFAQKILAKKI